MTTQRKERTFLLPSTMHLLVKKLKMKAKARKREKAKKPPATTTKKAIASRTINKTNTA